MLRKLIAEFVHNSTIDIVYLFQRAQTLYFYRGKYCIACSHKLADHHKPMPFKDGTCQWSGCDCMLISIHRPNSINRRENKTKPTLDNSIPLYCEK